MEAELIKESVITSYPSANLNLTVLAEGETIVPDTKSDIADIILVEGRCFIEKAEVQKGRIIFTGNAEFTVLYTPEDSEGISSLYAKIPFNHIEECENVTPEDKFSIHPETVHSECTLVNSRKISLKSVISVDFRSYTDIALSVVSDIRSPEIEVKKEEVYFSHLTSCIKENFTVSDFLSIPASSPPVASLLLCRVFVSDYSIKPVTGKAVVKGALTVFQLYLTENGTISHMQHNLPFTEILDAPSLTDESHCDMDFYVKTFSIIEDSAVENEQNYTFTADIALTVNAFSTEKKYIVKDAFLPGCETTLFPAPGKKSEIVCRELKSITLKESPDLPMDAPPMEQICPITSGVSSLTAKAENGKITVTGTVTAKIIYLSSGGKSLNLYEHEIPFTENFDCPCEDMYVRANATITHTDFNFINQAKLDLRCLLDLSVCGTKSTDSYPYLNNVVIGDQLRKKTSSIIIYFVKSGDTLWDIAKRYSTTEEKIILANALEKSDIINVGMRLLIPV